MVHGSIVRLGLICWRRRAAEQGAGADRFQRGGTWRIFMLRVLSLLVLWLVAAAQLGRSPAFSTSTFRPKSLTKCYTGKHLH